MKAALGPLAVLLSVVSPGSGAKPGGGAPPEFVEGFDAPRLDPTRWEITGEGDFAERIVDVVEARRTGVHDYRLRIRADTRGTRDDTVKVLGARSRIRFGLGPHARVAVDLDWNEQANGSYLSAALVLSPEATTHDPLAGPDWLKLEYVGVPPGGRARLLVAARVRGHDRTLFAEGWPEHGREGRYIGVATIALVCAASSFEVWENDRIVYVSPEPLALEKAYLYLQLSSHSNYPGRQVYFDNVRVQEGDGR